MLNNYVILLGVTVALCYVKKCHYLLEITQTYIYKWNFIMSQIRCKGITFSRPSCWGRETKIGDMLMMSKLPAGMVIFIISLLMGVFENCRSGSSYCSPQPMKTYEVFLQTPLLTLLDKYYSRWGFHTTQYPEYSHRELKSDSPNRESGCHWLLSSYQGIKAKLLHRSFRSCGDIYLFLRNSL